MKFLGKQAVISLLLSISICFIAYGKSNIALTDATHSIGVFGNSISFRFEAEPIFNYLPSEKDYQEADEQVASISMNQDREELHFFMPLAFIKGDKPKRFIHQMNVTKDLPFSVHVEAVKTPMDGLKCKVSFDPKLVGFKIDKFVSPKQEHGFTITFYKLDVLGKISSGHNNQNIIRTAQAEQKSDFLKKKYA